MSEPETIREKYAEMINPQLRELREQHAELLQAAEAVMDDFRNNRTPSADGSLRLLVKAVARCEAKP